MLKRLRRIATRTYAEMAIQIWVFTALGEVALSRADGYHKLEEKFFKPTLYKPENLTHELWWLPYIGDDGTRKKAILALAEQRGDTLAAREGCNELGTAIEYYEISGNKGKVKASKANAMRMSENFEKQGAYPAASRCYAVAGDQNKAAEMEQMSEAEREKRSAEYEKKEKVRQKKFSEEQDDLEKELGF